MARSYPRRRDSCVTLPVSGRAFPGSGRGVRPSRTRSAGGGSMARILTLTSWYPPHHFGGYELSCFDVMNRFVERGHEVRVLCGDERVPGAAPADPEHEALVYRK